MDEQHLERQSRHVLLDGFDEEGVRAVGQSCALVIGAGGLGCPAAIYLCASGIGSLTWVDGDVVDRTNLSRQILFGPDDVGRPKVTAGIEALRRTAPEVRYRAIAQFADATLLDELVSQASVILDCTDHWEIRQQINAACVRHAKPLVSGSAIQWSGQLMVFDPRHENHGCYACVFDPSLEPEQAACGAYGVLSPMVGAIGCLQAAEALKLLVRSGPSLTAAPPQRLSLLDMRSGVWQQLGIGRNPACPVCAHRRPAQGS